MKPEEIAQARELLYARHFGILSTLSVKLEGYPFGSVAPYCLDETGRPVLLISSIAQHTKNVNADKRCSLTIAREEDDIQANNRICMIGNMEKVPEASEAVRERYFRYFPQSKDYFKAHDFSFYYLDPVTIRYIGGFGAIYWIEPETFLHPNPFHGKGEAYIVDHMNEDHSDSLRRYLAHFKGIAVSPEAEVRMVGINEQGFDLMVDLKKVWFKFEKPVHNGTEAREALVAMSRAAK